MPDEPTTRVKEWSPALYEAAVGTGMAVCTEHRGRHAWVLLGPLGPDDGFCAGLAQERVRERILTDAQRRYLHGEIDYDELTAIRRAMDRPRADGS